MQSLVESLRQTWKGLIDEGRLEFYSRILEQILSSTGHLPTVHNVARGLGYCYFYARLSEIIGVTSYMESVSGKGRDVHKIVGLTLLEYVKDGMPEPLENKLNEYVNRAIEELSPLLKTNNYGELKESSLGLLRNLFYNVLPKATAKLNVEKDDLTPIVEQQFIDYDFHLRGSPDAILEDKKTKKAIVIEWKTYGGTPWDYEKLQVLAYALLEAARLGYRNRSDAIKAILGELHLINRHYVVSNFKILPVIVRETMSGELYPHPSLAPQNKVKNRYEEIEKYLQLIFIMAEHLTVLLTDIRHLTGHDLDEFRVPHPNNSSVRANILTLMPAPIRELRRRGSPREQSRFPCVARSGEPICRLLNPCNFYYGREINEWEAFERTLWGVRFDVLYEKEKSLMPYRALHTIFKRIDKDQVIETIKKGMGILFEVPYAVRQLERYGNKKITKRLIIERTVYELYPFRRVLKSESKRLDVLDRVEFKDDRIVGYRKIENQESQEDIIFAVSEGRPVLLSTLDGTTPLLSVNVFCRVDEVSVEDNYVRYVFSAPSRILRYQLILFGKYIQSYPELNRNVFVAELDADLTRLDQEAIDAIQRHLKDEGIDMDTDSSEIDDDAATLGDLLRKILKG